MMKIAIIGFGAIGKYVFDNLKKEKIFITSLICRRGREEAARKVLKSNIEDGLAVIQVEFLYGTDPH